MVEDLDRKFILNILKEDFKLLLIEKAMVLSTYESEINQIYKTENGKRFNYYFFSKNSDKLEKLVNTNFSLLNLYSALSETEVEFFNE